MFLLNKTLRGDAHLSGYRTVNSSLEFELCSRSSAKELQATLCYLIGNSFGMFLLNKTLREDAHIVQRKVAIATAQWRAKRSKSLMSEGNREPQRTCPLCSIYLKLIARRQVELIFS